MKRPALTAIASALAAVCAAVAVLTAAGGISSATALSSSQSASPAPASQTGSVVPPPPVSVIEPKTELADVDAGTTDAEPPPPAPFTDDPPSAEKSPRPKRSEWKNAPFIAFARSAEGRCKARRIREWVLVKCEIFGVDGLSLISGAREGVDVWMNTMEMSDASISIEFPVRRGDRRVFQINAQAFKYGSAAVAILSERWSESDPAPLLSVLPAF